MVIAYLWHAILRLPRPPPPAPLSRTPSNSKNPQVLHPPPLKRRRYFVSRFFSFLLCFIFYFLLLLFPIRKTRRTLLLMASAACLFPSRQALTSSDISRGTTPADTEINPSPPSSKYSICASASESARVFGFPKISRPKLAGKARGIGGGGGGEEA